MPINFSALSDQKLLGRILRYPLRWIPPSARLPIVQGRLRGKWWIAGAGDHGYWLGSYELRKQLFFERLVGAGQVVYDVGAHVGFYTLLASELVGPAGRVFAFEPAPRNLAYLRRHLALNRSPNVTIIEAAVSDRCGTAGFELTASSSMGHFQTSSPHQVSTLSLDDVVARGLAPEPDHIKIDVEGAEMLVLCGATRVLQASRPTLYLATDIGELHHQCCRFLKGLGYDLRPMDVPDLDASYEILACPRD